MPLQSSVAFKRQAKPKLHCRSPFVNEFGSSEPKIQNKKDKEASSELAFDPKELFPFVKEIGKNTDPDDCGDMNNEITGDINPPFDSSITQIDDKSWFNEINALHIQFNKSSQINFKTPESELHLAISDVLISIVMSNTSSNANRAADVSRGYVGDEMKMKRFLIYISYFNEPYHFKRFFIKQKNEFDLIILWEASHFHVERMSSSI
ncbi:hypothetical protein G4B88_029756 [Cannabis sativa]|uniref:Uncharacterized protein n=1 Tax=Cannabis sativa TaxID=3483 RepID=A0A7J6GEL6_CANSA|nr:hypothetical protein G4B88_029756 [Cannabis sativa]